MQKLLYIALLFGFISCSASKEENFVKKAVKQAEIQVEVLDDNLLSSQQNPRTLADNEIVTTPSKDWTSGFYPGILWYLYELTNNEKWINKAKHYTGNIEQEQFNSGTHDMGFKINCSYGNGYRLSSDEEYKKILIQSAKTLITRYDSTIGCIRSWDHHKHLWDYPVIIDNMINLELLFLATELTGDSIFFNIATSHADVTLANHFRKDYSTWHVIDYDTLTGKVQARNTHQGLNNESCWSRGEAWALYGFTMCYKNTGFNRYLDQAKHIASYILTHKNMPADFIPYWDFDAPNIPNEPRDASAAAIMASAFLQLSELSGESTYHKAGEKIVKSLYEKYSNKNGNNKGFILNNSVGSMAHNSEVSVPLIYADYYYLEACIRLLKSQQCN